MQDSPDADRAGHGAAAMLVMAAVTFRPGMRPCSAFSALRELQPR